MAFNTVQALLSSVLTDKNLAFVALAAIYAAYCSVTVVAPKIVSVLGPQFSMLVGAVPYVILVFVNIDPTPAWAPWGALLLPASVAVGFGAAVLWTGQGLYMSRCAIREAALTGETVDAVTGRLNGYFWTAFQFNGAVGALIAGVLRTYSIPVWKLFLSFGAVGCAGLFILLTLKSVGESSSNGNSAGASLNPDSDVAGLIAVDRDIDGHKDSGDEGGDDGSSGDSKNNEVSLVDTIRLIRLSPRMQCLVVLIMFNGASLGFNGAAFPLLYADPDSGNVKFMPASQVGYVAATFYAVNAASSAFFGRIIASWGRRLVFTVSMILAGLWMASIIAIGAGFLAPAHNSPMAYALVFGTVAVFAIGDSVLESQLPALLQSPSFFPRERDRNAASASLRMWMAFGFTLQFALGALLTPMQQIYVLVPLYVLGYGGLWVCDRMVQKIDFTEKVKGSELLASN